MKKNQTLSVNEAPFNKYNPSLKVVDLALLPAAQLEIFCCVRA